VRSECQFLGGWRRPRFRSWARVAAPYVTVATPIADANKPNPDFFRGAHERSVSVAKGSRMLACEVSKRSGLSADDFGKILEDLVRLNGGTGR
jgi:hypothetical protein